MVATPPYLAIRAHAGPNAGAGHWMRCLAIAQAWCDSGGRAVFIGTDDSLSLESRLEGRAMVAQRIKAEPGSPADALATARIVKKSGASWVILDGYCFSGEYQTCLKKDSGARLLVIDDMAQAARYDADAILNQNPHAEKKLYEGKTDGRTALLLGTEYALLRREFWQAGRPSHSKPGNLRKVLLTAGGGETFPVMAKFIGGFIKAGLTDTEAAGVYNGNAQARQKLEKLATDAGRKVRIISNASRMADLMAWADAAVSAAGSTLWELAYLGVPAVTVILADNQRPIADWLHERGIVLNLGWYKNVSEADISGALNRLASEPALRAEMSGRGRKLVDGKGVSRVLAFLRGKH